MDVNDILQWLALAATMLIGGLGLFLQHQALKVAREDLDLARKQLDLESKRHQTNSMTEMRKLDLEAQKLAERKAAREQKAMGSVLRWMLGEE